MSNKNKGFIGISVYTVHILEANKIDYLQVQVKKYYYFCKLHFINIYLFENISIVPGDIHIHPFT